MKHTAIAARCPGRGSSTSLCSVCAVHVVVEAYFLRSQCWPSLQSRFVHAPIFRFISFRAGGSSGRAFLCRNRIGSKIIIVRGILSVGISLAWYLRSSHTYLHPSVQANVCLRQKTVIEELHYRHYRIATLTRILPCRRKSSTAAP